MLFNSIEFAAFFPIICVLYFLSPYRARVPLLLLASCVFYMAFIPSYILILGLTILVDYTAGIYIFKTSGATRKIWLWGSVVCTCVILFIFKYFNFFLGSFTSIVAILGFQIPDAHWNIILPIGLSFHTFQSLSYVIEVYRGNQTPERNFVVYATYVMFFPQLVAGPIERPQNLLHQFRAEHDFDYNRIVSGLQRMAWGFFKKLVIADRLALYVNDVYGDPHSYTGLQLTLATFFFAYQIYCDFSGYSDIAIGCARVLGYTLMENFDKPYHSQSISEFWRRWHISLSTWFKDYIYVPLGGSRVSKARWATNILITFSISGLWHGANWTYVIWGLLNGVYLITGNIMHPFRNSFFNFIRVGEATAMRQMLRVASTFLLTSVAWVLFRAESVPDALYILTHLAFDWNFSQIATPQFLLRQLPVAVFALLLLEFGDTRWARLRLPPLFRRLTIVPRWVAYVSLLLFVVMFGVYRKAHFIYFQF